MLPVPTNDQLFDRATRRIPGGVNSPVRAFGAVGGRPYFVARAEGALLWDVEGNRYVDLIQSYGAVVAGHAHPAVVQAVVEAASFGTSYGVPTEREVMLAEEICTRTRGVDRVRLVNSGTEATMSAVRLARGFTGRDRIVKFAGNYHGHADMLLAAGGSGVATLGLSGSAGVPASAVADTVVAPYNVVPQLDESVAAVIVEPVAANMGLVAPEPGFLEGLRAECNRVGALLVLDEVITGFRLGPGGAAARYGVTGDLSCFGKVIGGGLPIGAYGGSAEVMAAVAPDGPVFQAGTLSGNPLATAAGLAVLSLLDDAAFERLETTATALAEGLSTALSAAGLDMRVDRVGTLVGLHAGTRRPRDYEGAKAQDERLFARLFHALADRGIAIAPGAYEVLFCGLAHSDDLVEEIVKATAEAAIEVADTA